MAHSAFNRQESRGAHERLDDCCTERDAVSLLKDTLSFYQPDCALLLFFFSSRRRHTRYWRDWSSDVCSSDLTHRSWSTACAPTRTGWWSTSRSEEHTSELQTRQYLVCRLLLEKKKKKKIYVFKKKKKKQRIKKKKEQ